VHLVRQDCGSCHGLTLRGGLGPALEPASLAGKDDDVLRFVILNGRRGTPMPPWREHLSESEAAWIVEQLRKGFPQ
jgi:cytochrome c55X